MRWDNLTLSNDEQARLPGYREAAVVRRFDAPEALDVRFYEVQAKSVLNRVPEKSFVPFRWTVNPYRGCTHACSYCVRGDTDILMADGRIRKLADLEVGERIYGTERRGHYRRFVETEVLDKWSTVKPAFRTLLADGTELVTSGDHRFLVECRGWKHVADAARPAQRPHLTENDELLGVGAFAEAPWAGADYRTGYLCGLLRGDATWGAYPNRRASGRVSTVHHFRLALCDGDALARAEGYLAREGVETRAFAFAEATATRRAIAAIRTGRRDHVKRINEIVRWPLSPSDDWRKGFLAGIFDAEGSCSGHALRIGNTDTQILAWVESCLRHFGFHCVVEDRGLPNRMRTVRLRGGLVERLRFFHLTDPAITRKRDLRGTAIKTDADLRVVSVEPLGRAMRLYDITTGTGDFIANGVVSHNCFARPTHTYLGFDAGRDFEREIVVKVNAPEVLRAQLAKPSWGREHVALGTNTDPYQWVERRYGLMPGIWEALRDSDTPCSVLTKSPLLLRDLPLFSELAERVGFTACLSVPTLDEKAWRASEPHTPHPRKRLEAVAELNRAGIPTGILIAPLMPGINDAPEQVERLLELATEAGAVSVGGIALHLRGDVRGVFMDWLRSYRPDLVGRYERLYARGAYAPKAERRRLAALVGGDDPIEPGRRRMRRFGHSAPAEVVRDGPAAAQRARRGDPTSPSAPPAGEEPRQEALFDDV